MTLGITVGVGAALPLVCQALPPFHVPTHEFTQLYTLVAAAVMFYLSGWLVRRAPAGRGSLPTARLSLGLSMAAGAALVMALTTFAVMAIVNALGPRCNTLGGAVFFWITWPPAVALTSVIGALLGQRQWRWHWLTAALAAVAGLSLLHDAAQALWGPQIVDLLVGKPLAFDVRAGMEIPRVHGLQRLWVVALAAAIWNVALWRQGLGEPGTDASARTRAARNRGVILAAALAMSALFAASHVGLGWGRGALHRHLSEEIRTEHFVVRHAPGGQGELFAASVADDAEWWWHWLVEQWGYEPDTRVWIYLFEDGQGLGEYTLTRSPHAQSHAINLTWYGALGNTLMHELIHVLHFDRVGARMPLLGRGLIEGYAMAYDGGYALHPHAHARLAAALRGGTLPRATQVMSLLGFWTVDEGNAYDAAGSFVGFLLHEYGWEAFDTLNRTGDYREAYGHDLAELDAQWRVFLGAVPVDMAEMTAARESFDPALQPSYSDECCPKLGSRTTDLDTQAQLRWGASDVPGALAIYRALFEEEGEPRWAFQIIQCLRRLEQDEEAVAVADEVLGRDDLPADEQYRFLDERLFCLMALRRWDAVEETLEAMSALQEPTEEMATLWTCLRDPLLRDALGHAAGHASRFDKRRAMEELLATRPGDAALHYLSVTWFLGGFPSRKLWVEPWVRHRLETLLGHAEFAPRALDERADMLLSVADDAIRSGDLPLAQRICGSMADGCARPLNRLHARRCLDRIAWQRD